MFSETLRVWIAADIPPGQWQLQQEGHILRWQLGCLTPVKALVENQVFWIHLVAIVHDHLSASFDGFCAVADCAVTLAIRVLVNGSWLAIQGVVEVAQADAAQEEGPYAVVVATRLIQGIIVGLCAALRELQALPIHRSSARAGTIEAEIVSSNRQTGSNLRSVPEVNLVDAVIDIAQDVSQPMGGFHGGTCEDLRVRSFTR